jgi:hypothetical protein
MKRAPFTPAEDGFAFANSFTNHVVKIPALGIDITTRGRCGGMAYAALDAWTNKLSVSKDGSLPQDGSLLADYIYSRLIDSMVANGFKFFHFMRTPDHPTWFNGIGVARATREEEFPRIKARIDQGFPCALGLCVSRDIGGMGNDHQVVAYGYEDGDPTSKVLVYDNNSPGQEVVLEFKTGYDPGDREVRMGGQTWRGFFMEAYAPVVPSFLQNGRLVSDRSDPAVFVVQGGGRFLIPSPQEFDACGYHWAEVVEAQDGSMAHIATSPGSGTLIKERSAAEVYVVLGGHAFHIPSPQAFDAMGFHGGDVRQVPDGSAAQLVAAPPRDGTLLKTLTDPKVYCVMGGQLHWIPDPATFEHLGLSWGKVMVAPDDGFADLTIGDPLPVQP